MTITLPDPVLIVLVGPSGSGKSTFAARHFQTTEVVSSDECRALVSDDQNNQAATPGAFRVLHAIARERMRAHRTTVIDATNVKPSSRKPLLTTANKYGIPAAALVFDLPLELCLERNRWRVSRSLPDDVIRRQYDQMRHSKSELGDEGFQAVHVFDSASTVETLSFAL